MKNKVPKKILFVCTGNRCRSVMAEGMLKQLLLETPFEIHVESAGTNPMEGLEPTAQTLIILEKEGIDLKEHKAKRVDSQMAEEADLIFVMHQTHKNWFLTEMPFAARKVFLLSDLDTNNSHGLIDIGIPDPIGMGDSFYENVAELIKSLCKEIVSVIARQQFKARPKQSSLSFPNVFIGNPEP